MEEENIIVPTNIAYTSCILQNNIEQLKKKYHKTEEVTNFKDMLYRSGDIYRSRTAFKLKNENDLVTVVISDTGIGMSEEIKMPEW